MPLVKRKRKRKVSIGEQVTLIKHILFHLNNWETIEMPVGTELFIVHISNNRYTLEQESTGYTISCLRTDFKRN